MQLTTYGKLNATQYALENAEPPADAFTFYWQQYEAASGPVLEPMCGTGRFLMNQWQSDWYALPDGSMMLASLLFRMEESGRLLRAAGKHERFVEGKLVETELDVYVDRFYEEAEFTELLRAAGFANVRVSRPFDGANYPGYLAFVCRKEE